MAYEHAQGKGRAFTNNRGKGPKAPHFNGTCNPEGTQREISIWIELNDGVDPSVIDKIKSSIKHLSVSIQEVYQKSEKSSGSNDQW